MIQSPIQNKLTTNYDPTDPSRSLPIRKKWASQHNAHFAVYDAYLQQELSKPLYSGVVPVLAIKQLVAGLSSLMAIQLMSGWQNPFTEAAYLRGITNANLDLRTLGIANVDGAQVAITGSAVHQMSIMAQQNRTQAMLRQVYIDTQAQLQLSLIEAANDGNDALREQSLNVLKRGLGTAVAVAGFVAVGIVADAFLSRMVDFGITLVSAVAEMAFTSAGDDRVCQRCLALEFQDNGNGPGVFTINQARGIIAVHFGCRCSWRVIVLGRKIPFVKF